LVYLRPSVESADKYSFFSADDADGRRWRQESGGRRDAVARSPGHYSAIGVRTKGSNRHFWQRISVCVLICGICVVCGKGRGFCPQMAQISQMR
jgi:hypothetical protein